VGDHDRGAALHEPVERLLHHALRLRVERRRRLVQKQDLGVLHDGPRDRNALLLPPAHLGAALPAQRGVPRGQLRNEAVRVGGLGGGHDLLLRRVGLAVQDVLPDAGGEQHRLLAHEADLLAVPLQVQAADVHAVEPDGAREGVVEALDELDDRGLPRSALADEGEGAPRRNGQGEAVEDCHLGARRILEADLAQFQGAPQRAQRLALGLRVDQGYPLQRGEDALDGPVRLADVGHHRRRLGNAHGPESEAHENDEHRIEVYPAFVDEERPDVQHEPPGRELHEL